jgi:hypothetical protein
VRLELYLTSVMDRHSVPHHSFASVDGTIVFDKPANAAPTPRRAPRSASVIGVEVCWWIHKQSIFYPGGRRAQGFAPFLILGRRPSMRSDHAEPDRCPLWVKKAKYSLRANNVRCCPDNRHIATAAPCPFSAKRGSGEPHSITSSARAMRSRASRYRFE